MRDFEILFVLLTLVVVNSEKRYTPDWKSLDSRPRPEWFDKVKIGVFLHWGVFSVPSYGPPGASSSEWFWDYWKSGNKGLEAFMERNYRPDFTYPDFAKDFTASFYQPKEWAELFEKAGIKYVVLTTKHHEGFTLWPSKSSFNWNAMDVGPKRDLVGDLADAVRNRSGMHFGVYYSMLEWFNPKYVNDRHASFKTQKFVEEKYMPELLELVNNYKPEIIWSDGDWEAGPEYWNSTQFLAWLYNDSPVKETVLVNDRWGKGVPCKHGDYYNCKDRYHPGVLLPYKWESAMTLDKKSWGYRRNMKSQDVMSINELLFNVVSTVSCNGNVLINVGPTKDGTIAPIFQERLLQLGQWLKVNGEAIYESKPWTHQNDTINEHVWYTSKGATVYATVLEWPETNKLVIGALNNLKNKNLIVTLLGYPGILTWEDTGNTTTIDVPSLSLMSDLKWAWTLKFSPAEKDERL